MKMGEKWVRNAREMESSDFVPGELHHPERVHLVVHAGARVEEFGLE